MDPNGLEIRLFELTDEQIGIKRTWSSRLAYYTIPTHSIEDSCARYEKFLAPSKSGRRRKSINDEVAASGRRNPADIIKEYTKSFRSVDVDDFVIGLPGSLVSFLQVSQKLPIYGWEMNRVPMILPFAGKSLSAILIL